MKRLTVVLMMAAILISMTACGGGGGGGDSGGSVGGAGNGGGSGGGDGLNGTALKAVDDAVAIKKWTPTGIRVLENDTGDMLAVVMLTPSVHGSVTINTAVTPEGMPPGTVVYYNQADGSFVGNDTFTYTVEDGYGNKATATVTVTILPNLLPLPVAVDDTATTPSGVPVNISVLDNDQNYVKEPGRLGFEYPAHGSVIFNPDFTITYLPTPGFVGEEVFTYGIQNADLESATGTVTVTVTP